MSLPLPGIKRADRLIALVVVNMLAIVWMVLVGFDTLTHFLSELNDVGENSYTLVDALVYIGWTMPRRFYEWFPNAALIGGLLGLGGLATSGEMTALRAAGMSKLRVTMSALLTLAVLTVCVMALGETLGAQGERQAQAVQLQEQSELLGMTNSTGLWARDGNRFINARTVLADYGSGDKRVRLVDVREFAFGADGHLKRFVHADSAVSGDAGWTLHDARISHIDADGVQHHSEKQRDWDTDLDASVLGDSTVRPDYQSMRELLANMHYMKHNGQSAETYAKAFWKHVFYPLNVLVLVLCALPFAFGALRSGGLGKRIFIGVVLSLLWYFLQQGLISVGVVYGLPIWLANLLPILALALLAGVYFRRYG